MGKFQDEYVLALRAEESRRAVRKLPKAERRAIAARVAREVKEQGPRGRHVASRSLYDNCLVLSPDGRLMFRTLRGRFHWYLENTPCHLVADDPPTLQLDFEPLGPGHIGDEYHLQQRLNRCVACGTTAFLTRHHVVPKCFRRRFPGNYVRRNQHDILPVCIHCHDAYECHAEVLKLRIAEELGAPFRLPEYVPDPTLFPVVKAARTLLEHEALPVHVRDACMRRIREHLGTEPRREDLIELARVNAFVRNPDYVEFGAAVVERLTDLQAFVTRWRRHFLDTMRPAFLPPGWDVERPLSTDMEGRWKPWSWQIARRRRATGASPTDPWWTFMEADEGNPCSASPTTLEKLASDGRGTGEAADV